MSDEQLLRKRKRRRRLLILLILVILAFGVSRSRLLTPSIPKETYVLIDLQGDYRERPPDGVVGRLFGDQTLSLLDLLLVLRDAREDDRVAGLVVRVRNLEVGWAKAAEIRRALATYADAGKPVIAYLEQEFGSGTLEYYVASAARMIYLPPAASAPLGGLRSEYVFLGGVWDKLDIDMQVEQIGAFKTMGDMLRERRMTAAHREMANSLLDSLYGQLVDAIAEGRSLDAEAVRASIDAAPATEAELRARGLTDGALFLDELERQLVGADGEFTTLEEFQSARRPPGGSPKHKLAIVLGVGAVFTGGNKGGAFEGRGGMASDVMIDAFHEAAEDDTVDAIVFRIDSPGGSALASDLIWRATQEARRRKPVIASMSDVAGSGGYYVAAGASKIVAEAGTLTGSIGVVVSKPNVSGFLEKLGVHTETLSRGAMAELTSVTNSLTEAEMERVKDSMKHVYDLFLARVAEGRDLSTAAVDAVGQGRVWTGAQAAENGLVDELGGLFTAIDLAKTEAGIPVSEKAELVFYPKDKSFLERVGGLLGDRIQEAPAWWNEVRSLLAAYEFPPGSILTLMPDRIEVR